MTRTHFLAIRLSGLAAAVLTAFASSALAAENGLQRYSPGVGGSDMTAPLVPGLYLQVPLVHYHAKKLRGGNATTATAATPITTPSVPNLRSQIRVVADTYAALPRLTYLSTTRVLGANLGFSMMLPVVKRQADFTGSPVFEGTALASASANQKAAITGGINANLATTSDGKETGLGDLELSALLHWQLADNQAFSIAPTIVLPTGKYDVRQRVNPGYGNFYTFRPSIQYSYLGDGWDVGVRTVLSVNTRNEDNGYHSGAMFNLDWQLMRFVSDDVRMGLQGYFVRQLTKDIQDLSKFSSAEILDKNLRKEIVNGNRSSVTAVGPALGWVVNGGEALVEGKFLQEFGARNRTEGQAFWLSISKPL